MSLAEYARYQKKAAQITKRNLDKYLENAEGILSPEEIEDSNKPSIEGFTRDELESGQKIDRDEALRKSIESLKDKINKLTNNDIVVTDYVIQGLNEDEIMNIESVFDEFISTYKLKYGNSQKTKEFFIQYIKAYLRKEHPEMKLYTDYYGDSTTSPNLNQVLQNTKNEFDKRRQDEENAQKTIIADLTKEKLANELKAKTETDAIEKAKKQAEADRKAEEAKKQAEIKRLQDEADAKLFEQKSDLLTKNLINNILPDREESLKNKIDKSIEYYVGKINTNISNVEKEIQKYNDLSNDMTTGTPTKFLSKEQLDVFYDKTNSKSMTSILQNVFPDTAVPRLVNDRYKYMTENFFNKLQYNLAKKFIINCLEDFNKNEEERDFVSVAMDKDKKIKVISDINFDEYKKKFNVDIIDLITSSTKPTTLYYSNKQDNYKNKVIKLVITDRNLLNELLNSTLINIHHTYKSMYQEIKSFYVDRGFDVINDDKSRGNVMDRDIGSVASAILYDSNKFDIKNVFKTYYQQKLNNMGNSPYLLDYIQYLSNDTNTFDFDEIYKTLSTLASTPTTGNGLKRGKSRVGKGSILTDLTHPLLYVDKKLLEKNMLSVKYKKNGNIHPKFKTVYISDDLKTAIVNNNHSVKLEPRENQILKNLVLLIGSEEQQKPFKANDDFNQKFKILLGQFRAGNDSKIVKTELKQYILAGLQENKLSRSVALDLMVELS